jgi:hypothetical protein
MKERMSYSELAIDAMSRAAKQAQKQAAERNLKMPIWKNGKIIYVESKQILKLITQDLTKH